jgi:hypothetical protein
MWYFHNLDLLNLSQIISLEILPFPPIRIVMPPLSTFRFASALTKITHQHRYSAELL